MLRPATPLSIALLISFVLLLLSTISTPVIKSIPLATYDGVNFGVFGYCTSGNSCTAVRIGYTTTGAFSSDNGDFQLPANTRHSLSSLLIVHPIAAFLNLVALALAGAAHLHSPSHSARYLLGLLILLLPTLLMTLLAFLVDILLFVPHLQWGSWIVLASVICIAVSGVFTCAMRRTLVSRKARKRRIAENAEMSGENFYARQAAEDKLPPLALTTVVDSRPPLVNGGPASDTLPSFAAYDGVNGRKIDDDRQPLNPLIGSNLTPVTSRGNASSSRSGSQPTEGQSPPHAISDQIPPLPPGAMNRDPSQFQDGGAVPPVRRAYSQTPRGRGGYPPRGVYPPRGGYGPGPGPRGPLPQGYAYGRAGYPGPGRGGRGGFAAGAAGGALAAGAMRHEQRQQQQQQPPGYGPQQGSLAPLPAEGVRAESPPPLDPSLSQSVENTGLPDQYRPARSDWNQAGTQSRSPPPPTDQIGVAYGEEQQQPAPRPRVSSGTSDSYYEDVDPRFSAPEPVPADLPAPASSIPRIQTPNRRNYDEANAPIPQQQLNPPPINSFSSYEDLPGARSPAGSEASHFTSVSQRGVNPNWRPGSGPDNFHNFGPASRPGGGVQAQQRRELLLAGNPDFELPSMGAPSGRPSGRGGMRGGPMPRRAAPSPLPATAIGAGEGPYPRGPSAMGDVREV